MRVRMRAGTANTDCRCQCLGSSLCTSLRAKHRMCPRTNKILDRVLEPITAIALRSNIVNFDCFVVTVTLLIVYAQRSANEDRAKVPNVTVSG